MSDVPLTWFVMRASGMVALALLTASVALGVLGPRLRPTWRLAAISAHRAAATAGSVLVAGHVVLAILDRWITLDWPAAMVPGAAGWQRWGVGLGAVAVDLLVALLVTTATRFRAPRAWRRVHLVGYPIWALSVGHGLLVGTDAAGMWTLSAVSAAVLVAALGLRLLLPAPRPPVTIVGARLATDGTAP